MATLSKGKTFTNGETVTPQKLHELVDLGSVSNIQTADIANAAVTTAKLADASITTAKIADAAVSDAKLSTIATAGKVANSATTAVSGNTPNAIVTRDASGNFSAGTMTGNVVGNADTATRLQTARTINGVAFDGTNNITVTAAPTSHTHAISDVTNLQTTLDGKAATAHTHAIANVTGLQAALDAKQAAGSYASASHTHDDRYYTEAEIDSRLSGLPVSGHTHDDRYYTETEMNSLLAGKQAVGSYAPATHTHAISDVTNLQTSLDGKATTSHFHGEITQQGSIGFISGRPIITTTNGVLTTGAFGNSSGTFCQGNDARLSDARTPLDGSVFTIKLADSSVTTSKILDSAISISKIADGNVITSKLADLNVTVEKIADLAITNQKIANNAAIADTKLAQITTANKVSNSATTATSVNTANAIVARDGNGDFYAGSIFSRKSSFLQADVSVYAAVASGSGAIGLIDIGQQNSNVGERFLGFFLNGSTCGSITRNGANSVAFNTSSDYRLKTNIEPLTDAVARLLQIPVHRFNWVADPNAPKVDGFLAHEAQAVVPESVTGHKDEVNAEGNPVHQGIDQSKLVPLLVAAVQELTARVKALEAAR